LEIERASALLIVEIDLRAAKTKLTPTIAPNKWNNNFEISILYNIIESSGN
jgi:hypothetical protein